MSALYSSISDFLFFKLPFELLGAGDLYMCQIVHSFQFSCAYTVNGDNRDLLLFSQQTKEL